MNLFHLKKWYFDCISDDGKIIYLYLTVLRIASLKFDKFFLYLFDTSDKKAFSVPLKIKNSTSTPKIFFNNGALLNLGNNYTLNIEGDNFEVSFSFISIGTTNFEDELIFSDPHKNFLTWKLLQPKARVKGKIHFNTANYSFEGMGYQDLVELTVPPWNLPIEELQWGRAHCNKYTVVYDLVKFKSGNKYKKLSFTIDKLENNLLNENGYNKYESVTTDNFEIIYRPDKKETEVKFQDSKLILTKLKTLTEKDVITDERIKPKFLRKLLSSCSGNPYESKYFGKALLTINGNYFEGSSIFEIVKWNW